MICSAFTPALVLALGQVWTVDDDGPADFQTLQSAVASQFVADGDVLLVAPGSHAGFQTGKALSVLSDPLLARPRIHSPLTFDGAPSFTLAGFEVSGIMAKSVAGRGQIDDITFWERGHVSVEGCPSLVVSRIEIIGDAGYWPFSAEGSTLALTNAGFIATSSGDTTLPTDGIPGLVVTACDATVSAVDSAGSMGDGLCGAIGCYACCQADGGDGLRTFDSLIRIAGSSKWALTGKPGSGSNAKGSSIEAHGTLLEVSGELLPNGIDSLEASEIHQPAIPRPFIEVLGTDGPGGTRRVLVHGPAGEPGILFSSLSPALFGLPGVVDGNIWLDPAQLLEAVPITTHGQEFSTVHAYPIPSAQGFEGLTLTIQVLFPGLQGTLDSGMVITNPGIIVLR